MTTAASFTSLHAPLADDNMEMSSPAHPIYDDDDIDIDFDEHIGGVELTAEQARRAWAGTAAAIASIAVGMGVRLVLFVLTPTIYGVENTLLYIDNGLVGATVDGWSTFAAAAASLVTYLAVAAVSRRRAADEEPAPLPAPVVPDLAVAG